MRLWIVRFYIVDALKICGKTCLDSYLNTPTEKDAQKVVEESFSSSFKFNDGNSKRTKRSLTIPAGIGNEDIMTKTDVIHSDYSFY